MVSLKLFLKYLDIVQSVNPVFFVFSKHEKSEEKFCHTDESFSNE